MWHVLLVCQSSQGIENQGLVSTHFTALQIYSVFSVIFFSKATLKGEFSANPTTWLVGPFIALLTDSFITDQAAVIQPLLDRFSITKDNLGYFVLDSAPNNDTILKELGQSMGFNPKEKRLRCMGHIFNLITKFYLYGQDTSTFDDTFKEAGSEKRRQLWRQRDKLGKLHNLVAHVMALGKRSDIFTTL